MEDVMDAVADIARKLKEARKAKGLSQRALAKLAGVPQSHISKIETTGVDLRISSLTEIARALDFALTLVPRKNVSAVNSIVRSTQPVAPRQIASIAKELAKLEAVAGKIAQQQKSLKEAVQLQSRVHELTRLELPSSYLDRIERLNKQLQQVYKEPEALQQLRDSLNQVQFLRNELAHNPGGRVQAEHRALYSLDEDDHG